MTVQHRPHTADDTLKFCVEILARLRPAALEQYCALAGYALVPHDIAILWESIEARLAIGVAVPSREIEAVRYAVAAGPYGDHCELKVFA